MAKTTSGVEYPAPGEDPQAWSEEGGRHRRPEGNQAAMDEVKERITLYNQIIEQLQRRQQLFDSLSPFDRDRKPVRRDAIVNDHGFVPGLVQPDDRCGFITGRVTEDGSAFIICGYPRTDHPTMWSSHRSDPWEMPRSGHAGRAPDNPSRAASVLSAVPPWQKHLLDRFTRAEGDTGTHLLAVPPPQQGWRPTPTQRLVAAVAGYDIVELNPETAEDRIPTKEDWKRWVAEGKATLTESEDGNVWVGVKPDGTYSISVPSEQVYEFLPTPEGMEPDVPIEDFPPMARGGIVWPDSPPAINLGPDDEGFIESDGEPPIWGPPEGDFRRRRR